MFQVTVIPFVFPGVPNVRCAFQTRRGGVSVGGYRDGNVSADAGDSDICVATNLEALKHVLGLDALAQAEQVHGRRLVFEPDQEHPERCDGLATARPGLGLMIKTADCQPVLLADEAGRHVAALHIGWRGNRMDFIGSAVAEFCWMYRLQPSQLCAVRGPSLGPSKSEFINFDSEWGPAFDAWHDAEAGTVDLWRMTRDQLSAAGLRPDRIYGLDLCTASLPELFYSYRNAHVTGRQASVIWMDR